ncbi:MAG TPA: hypothetical protein IAB61_02335 [Candidatus Merdisoma merdipullorum]|nr:hypothetical protein [Candidatus Merdisoma merdipullorum]
MGKGRKRFYGLGMILLSVCFVLCGACGKSVETQIAEQLELGEKYLEDEKYEEAVVAFQKVIELDEKEIRAYSGLLMIYQVTEDFDNGNNVIQTGLSVLEQLKEETTANEEINGSQIEFLEAARDFYKENGEKEKLYKILQLLLELDPQNKIYQENISAITYPEGYYADLSEPQIYKEYMEKIKYLYSIYENSGVDAVKKYLKENVEYFHLSGREDAIYVNAFIETEFYYGAKIYYGETDELGWPSGSGIALCHDNGETLFWIYAGNWENGQREGEGSYFSVNNAGELSAYDGEWKNDKPNGKGVIYREQNESTFDGSFTDVLYSYEKWTGTFTDGYYDGEFVEEYSGPEDYEATGHVARRLSEFNMGAPVPIEEGLVGFVFRDFQVFIEPLQIYQDDNCIVCRGCEICIEAGSVEAILGVNVDHYMPMMMALDSKWSVFGGFEEDL